MKTVITVLRAIILIALCSCSQSRSAFTQMVDDHKIVIIDTSGRGGSSKIDISHGYTEFSHEAGNSMVLFTNEVLFVNGDKYIIPNKTDSITIEDGSVKVNGSPVEPD